MSPSGDELKCEQEEIAKDKAKAIAAGNAKKAEEAEKAAAAGL